MGFTTRDTLILILVVNVTAAAGAFAFGQVQDRIGHVRTLVITLIGWLIAVVLAWMAESATSVLGRRQPGRAVPRLQPVGGPRAGRLPQPARAHGRVLRLVGARREALGDPRAR